jgi:hypothetical protein
MKWNTGFLKVVVRAPGTYAIVCLTAADKYLPHFSCPPGIHSKLFAAAVHQRSVGDGQPVFLVGKDNLRSWLPRDNHTTFGFQKPWNIINQLLNVTLQPSRTWRCISEGDVTLLIAAGRWTGVTATVARAY